MGPLPNFNDVKNNTIIELAFESTINNLKAKMEKLQAEVPAYKWYLQLQGVASPTIIHLNRCGVTNEDHLNINSLVLSFKNSNFIDDLAPTRNGNGVIKTGTLNNNEYWKRFIEKLKRLKNIHLAIDQSDVHF